MPYSVRLTADLTIAALVVVCLSVLFMQTRDERRAGSLESDVSETDSALDDPVDTKSAVSVTHDQIATR